MRAGSEPRRRESKPQKMAGRRPLGPLAWLPSCCRAKAAPAPRLQRASLRRTVGIRRHDCGESPRRWRHRAGEVAIVRIFGTAGGDDRRLLPCPGSNPGTSTGCSTAICDPATDERVTRLCLLWMKAPRKLSAATTWIEFTRHGGLIVVDAGAGAGACCRPGRPGRALRVPASGPS